MSSNAQSFKPNADTQDAFRRALGCFGTGVTVVTTNTAAGPVGFTANSFSSVSLDPPLIQWSVACDASRHDVFAQAQFFNVHVLAETQAGLARHFAKRGDGFDAFSWAFDENDVPALNKCLTRFCCETFALHPAGDHTIILGRVIKASRPNATTAGLMFAQRQFGRFVPSTEQD